MAFGARNKILKLPKKLLELLSGFQCSKKFGSSKKFFKTLKFLQTPSALQKHGIFLKLPKIVLKASKRLSKLVKKFLA